MCQFAWYEWVYYYDDSSTGQFLFPKARLGRDLGPAKNEGNEMTQWILNQNGENVMRITVRKLTKEQLAPSNDAEKANRDDFDADIRRKLGDTFSIPVDGLKPGGIKGEYDEYYGETPFWNDCDEEPTEIPVADCVDANGKPILDYSLTDVLISAEVLLPQGEEPQLSRFLR